MFRGQRSARARNLPWFAAQSKAAHGVAAEERESPLRGSLFKLKRTGKRFLPVWTRRFFAVEGGALRYYHGRRSVEPAGEVALADVSSVRRFQMDGGVFTFEVRAAERNLLLRAETAADAERWIRGLRLHVDNALGRDRHSVRPGRAQFGPPRPALSPRLSGRLAPEAKRCALEADWDSDSGSGSGSGSDSDDCRETELASSRDPSCVSSRPESPVGAPGRRTAWGPPAAPQRKRSGSPDLGLALGSLPGGVY